MRNSATERSNEMGRGRERERERERGQEGEEGRSTSHGGWRTTAKQGWRTDGGRERKPEAGVERIGWVVCCGAAAARARQFCSGHRRWIFAGAARASAKGPTPYARQQEREEGERRAKEEKGERGRVGDRSEEGGESGLSPSRAAIGRNLPRVVAASAVLVATASGRERFRARRHGDENVVETPKTEDTGGVVAGGGGTSGVKGTRPGRPGVKPTGRRTGDQSTRTA